MSDLRFKTNTLQANPVRLHANRPQADPIQIAADCPTCGPTGFHYSDLEARFDSQEVIRFQPWLLLESGTGAGTGYEIIQPASQWMFGQDAFTYHVKVEVSYLNGCTLYIESANTPEGPWNTVTSYTANQNTMIVLSSEGGTTRFSGYVRWRVSGDAPWQVCFQLQAVPGISVTERVGTPRKV